MRLSFKVWPQTVPWPELRDFWLEGDAIPSYWAGWVFDHFVPQTGWRNHEPLTDERGSCFEAWTLLSHLAALTARLRFGTLVSSITHRHPAVFAKMITTLDHLSGGRVEVGMGAGWNAEEHLQFGIEYPPAGERFDRLDEYLDVLISLLDREPAWFAGKYYSLNGGYSEPPAVQRPRPPLTVGGKGERRALPAVARWADHWNYPGGPVAEFRHKLGVVHTLLEQAGRERDALEVSAQVRFTDLDGVVRSGHDYAEAGATHLVVWFNDALSPRLLGDLAGRAEREFDIEKLSRGGSE